MLQELGAASGMPRKAGDLVKLWEEPWVIFTLCCSNQDTCFLCTSQVTTLLPKAMQSTSRKS